MIDEPSLSREFEHSCKSACDALEVPVTIANPDLKDTPLIYVNPAFEKLTLYDADDVIGRNCRFLQGPQTDRTVTDELAHACETRSAAAFCLVNYRKDGTAFFNLLAIQPIHIGRKRTLLMGCQFAFRPTQVANTLERTSTLIDGAQRKLRFGTRTGANSIEIHDTFRLDAITMRFEAAFVRMKDQLLRSANSRMLEKISSNG